MSTTDTNAESIVREPRDCLLRVDLKVTKCCGQYYDGCSTMKGPKNGVVVKIKKEEQRALYSHCYVYSLNLAVGDTMKSSKVLQDTIDTTFELTKLIKFSPKRDAVLCNLQSQINNEAFEDFVKPPQVTPFCPTRWTICADCLNAVIENYDQLQELWEWSLQNSNDTETKPRIHGVSAHTKTFAFCFGIHLAHLILGHSDNLSRALQSAKLSANEAQEMACCTVMVLRSLRTEDNFELFCKTVTNFAKQHDAGQASLPRKRKAPSKIIFGKAPHEDPQAPADNYRVKFFEVLDLVINCIEDRFNQKDYRMYATCEQLLIKAVKKEDFSDEISGVMDFYNDKFNARMIKIQLQLLPSAMTDNININSLKEIQNQVKLL